MRDTVGPLGRPAGMDDWTLTLDDGTPRSRAERWRAAVPRVFDGLSARTDGVGPIRLVATRFGPGRLVVVGGTASTIERAISRADASSELVNVVVQARGSTIVTSAGSTAELRAGEVALIDGARPFTFELGPDYEHVVVQLPRTLVGRRHDRLLAAAGPRIEPGPGTALVVGWLRELAARLPALDAASRAHTFDAVVACVGLLVPAPAADRFSRAVADIDAALPDPDLSVGALAARQGISRRRLDAVFAARGVRGSALIWSRRLDRIAAALRDPANRGVPIVDLALAWGFSSQAHFSRSFRRRFGVRPSDYRRG